MLCIFQREESMRRLLEWKQRMLQSPLNRKIQGNVAYRGKTDIYNNNEMGYKLSKHSKYNNEAYMDDFHSKSSTQYNSYSSDDEGKLHSVMFLVGIKLRYTYRINLFEELLF